MNEAMRSAWASARAGRAAEASPTVVCRRRLASTTNGLNIHAIPPKNWA